ncbi:hypothetical protein [Prosthecobacter vanneervenii]|uniref:Peptidase S8/S53 domain-containing protein n=1 Tax=Prosthecobacter vanneervenii TaxID=48466 RepID=A0A7W7YF63_9BACT|nr:hypothetical protein [Prosthecobacter vanneervenii]MBB5034959.1 hypothetical protein [Prosthecobacter vanneervenii]
MSFTQQFHRSTRTCLGMAAALLLAGQGLVHADWRDDIGYTQLATELGASVPTGAGVILLQSEANDQTSPPNYLPQAGGPGAFAGASPYAGITFYAESTAGVVLSHAQSVAYYYYANGSGISQGSTEVHVYTATDFLNRLYTGTSPPTFPGRVQNHSWIGSTDATTDPQLLRSLDFMINRDGTLVAVPLNNNTDPMPALLGNNYHALTAGLRSGLHSRGGTNTDGSGRMKPDLVVNVGETSYASPTIAGSAAALLQSAIATGNANAQKPQAIKAQMIAGASKQNLPQWQRLSTSAPYDAVFGAGELNIRNAYYIQQAGQRGYSTSTEVPSRGWDYNTTTNNAAGRRYFFSIPAGRYATTFSAAITWHRSITGFNGGAYSSSLSNLDLALYASTNFTPGASALYTSASTVDNVEHVFAYNLPPGQYMLVVTSATNNRAYGLAWDAQLGGGPALAPQFSGSQWQLAASSLDPYLSYTIESSPDLVSGWTTELTFRMADTTPAYTYTWQPPQSASRYFYRLKWTPVR